MSDEAWGSLGAEQAEELLRTKAADPPEGRTELLSIAIVGPRQSRRAVGGDGEAVRLAVNCARKIEVHRTGCGVHRLTPSVVSIRPNGDRPSHVAAESDPVARRQALEG